MFSLAVCGPDMPKGEKDAFRGVEHDEAHGNDEGRSFWSSLELDELVPPDSESSSLVIQR